MAGSADAADLLRREVESGSDDTDTDDEDARYYLQSRHDNDEWVSVSVSAGSSTPAYSFESDKTISAGSSTPVHSASDSNPVVDGGSGGARSSVDPSPSGAAAAPVQVPFAPAPAPPQQATSIPLMVPATSQQRVSDGPLHFFARRDRQSPSGNRERGFTCQECGRWFPTHQGLGGHAAGHKNRRIAAAAVAAAAAGMDPQEHTGGVRPVKVHACKICGVEYTSGVSLGGHMRKHYNGKPIVPKKRLCLYHPDFASTPPIVAPPVASVAEAAAQPPQAVPGTMRLFGVNIVQQTKEEEEEPLADEPMNEQ